MSEFTISTMQDAAILNIIDMESIINIDPDYQRPGSVWSLSKKQLFIDSLINGYDIPKFYFHVLPQGSGQKKYAIIDGRQRLEAIWGFADNKFTLADDFKFFHNEEISVGRLSIAELAEKHPRLYTKFNSRTLAVTLIDTEDFDIIEDMFSRLNEAVPLNAAEKRNALGGTLPIAIREIASLDFFTECIKVNPSRYRHHDIIVKMLYQESSDKILDTKKASLDRFTTVYRDQNNDISCIKIRAVDILKHMENVFQEKDVLLKSSGNVVLYYILYSKLIKENKKLPSRDDFIQFERLREENRRKMQSSDESSWDIKIDYTLIEYDDLAQSSNDASAIEARYKILRQYFGV